MEELLQTFASAVNNSNSRSNTMTYIRNWKQYADLSHDQQKVAQQWEHLQWTNYGSKHQLKRTHKCVHHSFQSPTHFLTLLQAYMNNDVFAVQHVRNHDNNTLSELDQIKT
eukprot:69792_1